MTIDRYRILLIISLVLLASVLGILSLYAHTIMPGLRHVDDRTFVQAYQAIDRQIINPIFMLQFFVPVFLLGVAGYYARKHHLLGTKYVIAAFVCYLIAVIVTMAVNVPLNDAIKRVTDVTSQQSLADARTQFGEARWALFNLIRTIATLAAVACTSVALWGAKSPIK